MTSLVFSTEHRDALGMVRVTRTGLGDLLPWDLGRVDPAAASHLFDAMTWTLNREIDGGLRPVCSVNVAIVTGGDRGHPAEWVPEFMAGVPSWNRPAAWVVEALSRLFTWSSGRTAPSPIDALERELRGCVVQIALVDRFEYPSGGAPDPVLEALLLRTILSHSSGGIAYVFGREGEVHPDLVPALKLRLVAGYLACVDDDSPPAWGPPEGWRPWWSLDNAFQVDPVAPSEAEVLAETRASEAALYAEEMSDEACPVAPSSWKASPAEVDRIFAKGKQEPEDDDEPMPTEPEEDVGKPSGPIYAGNTLVGWKGYRFLVRDDATGMDWTAGEYDVDTVRLYTPDGNDATSWPDVTFGKGQQYAIDFFRRNGGTVPPKAKDGEA